MKLFRLEEELVYKYLQINNCLSRSWCRNYAREVVLGNMKDGKEDSKILFTRKKPYRHVRHIVHYRILMTVISVYALNILLDWIIHYQKKKE